MSGSQSQTQTSNSSVDPQTRAYIEAYRTRAQNQPTYQTGLGGLDQYMNPYRNEVIGQIQAEGNRQGAQANAYAGDQATRAGAYGGSREAVLRGQLIGDVNRQTGQNVAQYTASGYEDAANRLMQDRQFAANNGINQLNALTPGFNPTSQTNTSTMTQRTPLFPQILGLAGTIGGGLIGGPVGAGIGGSLGSGFGAGSVTGAAPRIGGGGGLNFGNAGGGYSFGGQGGWNPQVLRRSPWRN